MSYEEIIAKRRKECEETGHQWHYWGDNGGPTYAGPGWVARSCEHCFTLERVQRREPKRNDNE